MVSLYVHFPFCLKKCLYCDFNSLSDSPVDRDEYLDALLREMELCAPAGGTSHARSLYFGGGTPSLIAPRRVGEIIDAAARLYRLGSRAEVTLEANPGTLTASSLAGYRAAGVNRLSLGVQSLHDDLLIRLGRLHTAADAVTAVAAARKAGFDNLGIDLMHSLPGETLNLWREDLARALQLLPEHISTYGLTVETGTPFHELAARGDILLPEEDDALAMFCSTGEILEGAGYRQYEIANFARIGFESRHNQVYWRRGTYLGFGAGAHSFQAVPRGGRRWKNENGVGAYLESLRHERRPEEEVSVVTPREAMAEFMFLGLRILAGVDNRRFRREFGSGIEDTFHEECAWLLQNGLLERAGERYRLTRRALPLANQVFMRFV